MYISRHSSKSYFARFLSSSQATAVMRCELYDPLFSLWLRDLKDLPQDNINVILPLWYCDDSMTMWYSIQYNFPKIFHVFILISQNYIIKILRRKYYRRSNIYRIRIAMNISRIKLIAKNFLVVKLWHLLISRHFVNHAQQKLYGTQFVRQVSQYYNGWNYRVACQTNDHVPWNEIRFRLRVAPRRFNENVILPCCRITAKIDDDMIRYYVDEDLFLLEVSHSRINPDSERNNPGSPGDPGDPGDPPAGYDVTLIELPSSPPHLPHSPLANSTHAHVHVHDNSNTWIRTDKKCLCKCATQAWRGLVHSGWRISNILRWIMTIAESSSEFSRATLKILVWFSRWRARQERSSREIQGATC